MIEFGYEGFDQGKCTYVRITLCTPTFSFSLPSPFYQGSALSLPMSLPILIVLLLHSPLTSRPSQIEGKGEELRIQKNPDPYYY